jgi:hypothetical protein
LWNNSEFARNPHKSDREVWLCRYTIPRVETAIPSSVFNKDQFKKLILVVDLGFEACVRITRPNQRKNFNLQIAREDFYL